MSGTAASLFYPWRLRQWRLSPIVLFLTSLSSSSAPSTVCFKRIIIPFLSFSVCMMAFSHEFIFSLIHFSCRLLFPSAFSSFSSTGCLAAMHCAFFSFVDSFSCCFFLNLILHSGFIDAVHIWTVSASFCRTFSRTMCSRCSFWQTIEAACRLGIVHLGARSFRLLIIRAIQIPIHFGLLCDMREELSDTKWQDCDPQSWSLWYDS
jgi:hypothetical protein